MRTVSQNCPTGRLFAGSVATADLLVRNMIKLAGVPLADAVKMRVVDARKYHRLS